MVSIPTLGKYEAHFNRRFCCMNCWQTRRGLAFSETAESRDKPVTIIQSMLRRRLMYTFVFDPQLDVKKGPHTPRAFPALHLGASSVMEFKPYVSKNNGVAVGCAHTKRVSHRKVLPNTVCNSRSNKWYAARLLIRGGPREREVSQSGESRSGERRLVTQFFFPGYLL